MNNSETKKAIQVQHVEADLDLLTAPNVKEIPGWRHTVVGNSYSSPVDPEIIAQMPDTKPGQKFWWQYNLVTWILAKLRGQI